MNKYIFITNEGITYQPNSKSIETDCENAYYEGKVSLGEVCKTLNLKTKHVDMIERVVMF